MSEKIPPRFRKTKTEKWAVMAPVVDLEKALSEGGKIEVQKKSGDWSSFTVASLGKPFDVDGVEMCYGYAPGDEDPQSGGGQGGSGQARSQSGSQPDHQSDGDRDRSRSTPAGPGRDQSEPMPEYQGGPEDEWNEF